MPLQHAQLVKRVEDALKEGLGSDLDLHELAEFVVDYVKQPQTTGPMDRRQIIAERLKEL